MKLKAILVASAASLITASAAQAADAIIAPEPESVEYVRVCDAYGAGYFYIPGTETCMRIGGYLRYSVDAGKDPYTGANVGYSSPRLRYNAPVGEPEINGEPNPDYEPGFWERDGSSEHKTWGKSARFALNTYTATETELGTLTTFTESRFDYGNGSYSNAAAKYAYMQLGGLRVGKDESAFHTLTDYLGAFSNDDVVNPGVYDTNLISYTFAAGNGFSAIVSLEQGSGAYATGREYVVFNSDGDQLLDAYGNPALLPEVKSNRIDSYMPHVVGGVKFEQAWGAIAAVAAYDSNLEEWAGKVKLDVNVTDQLSLWVQGGYASYEDAIGMYGAWGGDWAVWGGAAYKINDKATVNLQAAYEDWGKTALAANVAYNLVPGLLLRPEVLYTSWKKDHPARLAGDAPKDATGFHLRIQRSF